ncbi:hypothetical protein [Ramlibacter pallidus]|uniref:Uncharacterized protein n=1 Tax=Ramlibacter pallidus TaxID=2780087 RepID=A0ABR9RZE1_9BURK|nr:hypothetical protein [Ramlibacter pallidus]MBE7366412.1 hypothetical protein [Ramlibacter pallidus]
MSRSPAAGERVKTLFQVLAIIALAGIVFMVFHKGYTDFKALERAHPPDSFWLEYVRNLFRNLAG